MKNRIVTTTLVTIAVVSFVLLAAGSFAYQHHKDARQAEADKRVDIAAEAYHAQILKEQTDRAIAAEANTSAAQAKAAAACKRLTTARITIPECQ